MGHEGESSVTTCCSLIRLVVLPEKGLVISVQPDTSTDVGDPHRRAADGVPGRQAGYDELISIEAGVLDTLTFE